MKNYLILLLLPLLLSCEKEIDIGYREADQLYVAEAMLTQVEAKVRLSTTQNVTDNNKNSHIVKDATVVLSDKSSGLKETLRYISGGYYRASIKGEPGVTYDLDIYVGDRHFSSLSTMQEPPEVLSFRFVWQKMISERILFGDLRIQDDPDRNNYYFIQIFRNYVSYQWSVMNDEKNKGGELQKLIGCSSESDMDKGDEDALHEDDALRIEVRAIDRISYDYLYSLQMMSSSGTNPKQHFTGGCLGYFSAYSYVNLYKTFHRCEIEEEE